MSESKEEEVESHLVIDNGSDTIKFGLSTDDSPRVVFPNIVGLDACFI